MHKTFTSLILTLAIGSAFAAAEDPTAVDAMIADRLSRSAAASQWQSAGPKVDARLSLPALEPQEVLAEAPMPAAALRTQRRAPGAIRYGNIYSKDTYRNGNVGHFAMQLTSTGGRDSIANVYGLGTKIGVEIDEKNGTFKIPAQRIYQHSSYGPIFICPISISGSSFTYDKEGTIVGTIDANGCIELPSWGLMVVEGQQAGGAIVTVASSSWYAANASLKISLTDNSTLEGDAYVEQTSPNEVCIYNFAGTGLPAKAVLSASGLAKVAPQYMGTMADYGDFYCYAADWENQRINVTTAIKGVANEMMLTFSSWAVAAHRSGNPVALKVKRSTITLTDGEISLPQGGAKLSGEGTQASPWLISSPADLLTFSQTVGGGDSMKGKFVALAADIDMSAISDAFFPIGDALSPFDGTFDGAGHTISNLHIDGQALGNAGLFGYTGPESTVKGVKLASAVVNGVGHYLGGIVGTNYGLIDDCHVDGTFKSEALFAGGISGAGWGPIRNCSFSGKMTTVGIAAGIVGTNFNEVRGCHADADIVITGAIDNYYHDIAGIAGVATPGKDMQQIIADCSFSGSLTDARGYGYMAGIVSKTLGATVERCANTATITGIRANPDNDVYAGGIIAWCSESTVRECLNSGTIAKSGLATMGNGGIIGYLSIGYSLLHETPKPVGLSTVENCYNSGQIVSAYNQPRKGIWGYTFFKDEVPDPLAGCFKNCYNDYQATGLRFADFNATTEQLTSGSLPQGFTADAWTVAPGRYPVLKSMPEQAALLASAALCLSGTETVNKVKNTMTISADPKIGWDIYYNEKYADESTGLRINGTKIELKDTYSTEVVRARIDDRVYKLFRLSVIPALFEGEGTIESPYLISSPADFRNLDRAVSHYGQPHEGDIFVMTKDIDFAGIDDFNGVGLDGETGFGGTFDGQGHTVRNLRIHAAAFDSEGNALASGKRYGGLFSKVMAEGVIKNVNTADCDFIFHEYGGAIVGSCVGRVENCRNYSDVRGVSHNMGGIVGQLVAGGTVSGCYNAGSVVAGGYRAGGIVGENGGRIEFCQNDGYVASERYSTLWPRLNHYGAGGIAGLSRGEIEGCVNQGLVRCLSSVGGIVGENSKSASKGTGNIINCLNSGPVDCTGTADTRGAIAGKLGSYEEISGCVYDLAVATDGPVNNQANRGIKGYVTSALTDGKAIEALPDSLFDYKASTYPVLKRFASESASTLQRSAYPLFSGKASRLDVEPQTQLSQAESLVWTLRNGNHFSITGSTLGVSLPADSLMVADTLIAMAGTRLLKEIPVQTVRILFEGDGTEQNPYIIANTDDMLNLAHTIDRAGINFRGDFFRQTADLDFSGKECMQVASGIRSFQGDFDGQNKKITYTLDKTATRLGRSIALFGTVGEDGSVRNLTVVPTVSGEADVAGAIVNLYGKAEGIINAGTVSSTGNVAAGIVAVAYPGASISDSHNQGTVTSGSSFAAGIAGRIQEGASAAGCSNSGRVVATSSNASGIVSDLDGRIDRCSNSGSVEGRSYAGGIVGGLGETGVVADCVNTSDITSTSGGYIGGIVGNTTSKSVSARITGCVNKGAVTANQFAAGIVTQVRDGVAVDSCRNEGAITSAGNGAGGIAGKIEGSTSATSSMADCFNAGSVKGSGQYIGGVVGQISTGASMSRSANVADVANRKAGAGKAYLTGGVAGICSGAISECWNAGNIDSDGYGTGGVVGYISGGSVEKSFSVGNVKAGNADTPEGYGAAGGFVGYIGGSGSVSDCYAMGTVEAPDNVSGFAAAIFNGAKITNVYTTANVIADASAKRASRIFDYSASASADKTFITNAYYLDDAGAQTSAADSRAKAMSEKEMFSAPLGEAFTLVRGAYPTLTDIADNSYGHLYAVKYEFENEGDSETNVNRRLLLAPFTDIVWTSSEHFIISDSHAYPAQLGEGWIEVSLPDGSRTRRFNLTVNDVSGVDSIESDASEAEYFDLNGRRVANPAAGIYIERRGSTTRKVVIR